ncbi:MAG TPA: SUMF1/EgtB/PvdO family nonheme iron enzyme [Terriglobales bacterium]|nr:SUMF1/EgtB/PvdO family nonheme iron enzyme [Terriglobales bacterium]
MLAVQNDPAIMRSLQQRVFEARRRSDDLFALVRPDSIYERPIPARHRIIFYLGHLEAFDWNLLHENVFGLKSFHPEFDRLFAFGIDPVGGGLPCDQPSDWPSLQVVRDYVGRIRAALDDKLAVLDDKLNDGELKHEEPGDRQADEHSIETLLNVAVEHRLMHVETLAYMLHQLTPQQKIQQIDAHDLVSSPVNHRMIAVPAGPAILGLSRSGHFGWDNEYEIHSVQVPAFEIDQSMVTNRQFLDFVASGGYETRAFWSDDDWNWRTAEDVSHPVFWERANGHWLYRTMFDRVPLPLDWPVYVSHAEATAFARWAGKSLPTEAEWHRAAYGTVDGRENVYPWGAEAPDSRHGNFDFHRWDAAPVNAFPAGRSAFGVDGMLGNGWEWTSTVFAPFPGFEPFAFYRGYSANFFDGKHFVMKGGSPRTAACMLRPTFRNWFQPHYQYVYAGFRCVSR